MFRIREGRKSHLLFRLLHRYFGFGLSPVVIIFQMLSQMSDDGRFQT